MPHPQFLNIGWTVGSHCNARCPHCYSWKVREDRSQHLSEADQDRVIGQLLELGVRTVNIGGNEPIYTHGPRLEDSLLPALLRKLHRAGLPVGITTNGITFRHLLEHFPDELATINDIDFSLDMPHRHLHDQGRGARLFDLVVESIQQCRKLGIARSITFCGTRDSFQPDMLRDFMDLAWLLDSELRVNILKPVEPSLLPLMPSRDAFYHGFAQLMAHTDCITLGESCLTAFTGSGARGCPCGLSSFRINGRTPDGRVPVGPCIYVHEYRGGDLLSEPLRDIVTSSRFERFTARQREVPRVCREADCPYLEICRGGCAARTWFVHGTLEAKDPYCPLDYMADHGERPPLPLDPVVGADDTLRVHDNYLCTWIGRLRDTHEPRRCDLSQFRTPGIRP